MLKLDEALMGEMETLRWDQGVSISKTCARVNVSTKSFYEWKARGEAGEGWPFDAFVQRVVLPRPRLVVPADEWRDIEHFKAWVAGDETDQALVLDSGEVWVPEDWQLSAVEDILSDVFQAVWLIVPEGNGKTTLVAAIVIYLLEHQITPEIPIGSATTTQAETLFRQIEGFIVRSGKLNDFNLAPGVRRADCRKTHGHVRVYPHKERSADGVIPSAWVLDEGHLHPDMRLYRVWKGKYRKRRGVGIGISTAGEPTGEFEELRASLLNDPDEVLQRGPYIRAVKGSTVVHDWAVRDKADMEDMEVVAAANPLESIDAGWLAEKRAEPEMTDPHWLRRTCNIAAREEGQAIEPADWDALAEPDVVPDRSAWSVGWVDLGYQIDCTAVGVLVWEDDKRRVVAGVKILKPPVDETDIVKALVALQREFQPEGWVYDPNAGGRQMAQLLDRGNHPDQDGVEFTFVEHPQHPVPMSLAAVRLEEAIRNGWLVHDGDPELRRHVLNAVKKSIGGERWRFDKPPEASGTKGAQRAKYWNDALIGLTMGHSNAVAEHELEPEGAVYQF